MTARIVIYGVDDVLLITRQAILSKAGLSPRATSEIGDVIDFLKTDDPVLLVVCSSVEHTLRNTLLSAVDKVGKHNLRKLILAKHMGDEPQANTKMLQTPTSPQTFISIVREAIR